MTSTEDFKLAPVLVSEGVISTAINALIPATIIYLVGLPPPAEIGGGDGLLSSLVKATVLPVFLMTLILTAILRARRKAGSLPTLAATQVGWLRLFTPYVLMRAVLFSIVGLLVILPCGVLASQVLGVLPLDKTGFAIFNVLYGAAIGILVTPFVVLTALSDPTPTAKAAGT